MTTNPLFWAVLSALVIGVVGGMVPWKSRRLSPASIQRRFYWTSCVVVIALVFLAGLPDWRSSIFAACAVALGVVVLAFAATSHIKIGGRIWARFRYLRRPDPPPRLAPTDHSTPE